MKVLLCDNYDSFTYNLLHILNELGATVDVRRNDQIQLEEVQLYDKILISPGPGIPEEAGILLPLIKEYAPTKSILGVCLGEQAIGQAFEAHLINLKEVYHGIASPIRVTVPDPLFAGMGETFTAGRYHSWVVALDDFPSSLEVIAQDADDGQIMGLRHKTYDVKGIQFHPESVLTPRGNQIIRNWLKV